MPRNLDSLFYSCTVLDSFLSFSVKFLFSVSLGCCFVNCRKAPQNGILFGKLKQIILLSIILRPLLRIYPDSFLPFPFISSSLSVCLSVQDTTPEGVLCLCWCFLTLTLTTSIGIWYNADVTKAVTSPATHRGIWHSAGATKS